MTKLLSAAELNDLIAITRDNVGTLTLGGKPVPFEAPSVGHYLKYVVARFEAPRAFFVMTAQVEAARRAIDDAIEKGVEPTAEDLNLVDTEGYMTANARDQADADAALVAVAVGAAGNEKFETWLLGLEDEEFEVALKTVEKAMWGEDPARFFGVVARKLAGRTLQTLTTAAAARKSSQSSPKKPSSTSSGTAKKKPASRRATRG